MAILLRGCFGSLSGRVISNLISTGAMTIPTMKRCGHPPAYAAAAESRASTDGARMPLGRLRHGVVHERALRRPHGRGGDARS